jgi:hypothetical protein
VFEKNKFYEILKNALSVTSWATFWVIFVEQSSTKERTRLPPPNPETIASKQACFIKQTNIFI